MKQNAKQGYPGGKAPGKAKKKAAKPEAHTLTLRITDPAEWEAVVKLQGLLHERTASGALMNAALQFVQLKNENVETFRKLHQAEAETERWKGIVLDYQQASKAIREAKI